jgi:hypothetical protein
MITAAAKGGHLALLRWLETNTQCRWDRREVEAAAANGHLETVRWLITQGYHDRYDDDHRLTEVCSQAAKGGHLHVLQHVRSVAAPIGPFPWDGRTLHDAALGGFLEVVQWAYENGCRWNSSEEAQEICAAAAYSGSLDLLQYLRSLECPWSRTTCHAAALGGQLEVLRWADGQSCAWNLGTITYCAAAAGAPHVIEWARSQGHDNEWDTYSFLVAGQNVRLDTIRWLRANGCPWDEKNLKKSLKLARDREAAMKARKAKFVQLFGRSWAASMGTTIMSKESPLALVRFPPTDDPRFALPHLFSHAQSLEWERTDTCQSMALCAWEKR